MLAIAHTLFHHAPVAVAAIFLFMVVTAVFALQNVIPRTTGLVLLVTLAVSPLTSLTYAAQGLQLNDPERVAYPIAGVMAFVLIQWCRFMVPSVAATPTVVFSLLTLASMAIALASLLVWHDYSVVQTRTLRAVGAEIPKIRVNSELILEDYSGTLGDVYTLLPPYIGIAADYEFNSHVPVTICTPDGVVRQQPIAAAYPLQTTPGCSKLVKKAVLHKMSEFVLQGQEVKLFEVSSSQVTK